MRLTYNLFLKNKWTKIDLYYECNIHTNYYFLSPGVGGVHVSEPAMNDIKIIRNIDVVAEQKANI